MSLKEISYVARMACILVFFYHFIAWNFLDNVMERAKKVIFDAQWLSGCFEYRQ